MLFKISCDVWLVILGVLVAVVLRVCTSLHPYSGAGAPPMWGDYEAQRHWMALTNELPLQEWYREGPRNNLTYWGLDYPPLTAYHMWLCGALGAKLDPTWSEQGHESGPHKLFMRYTVLISDLLLFIPAIIIYHAGPQKTQEKPLPPSLSTILSLLYPGIILIDHGHFQYNCVSLALLLYATIFILTKKHIWASIFFCLALNYKQMELYHSLPFFLYLLSACVPKPGMGPHTALLNLIKLAATVILTFVIIWFPFLWLGQTENVIFRLFPVARGVFEDKVANFWCVLNVFHKLKSLYSNQEMMRVCLFATLTAVFPSSIDLFLRPNVQKFVPALINSSLAFFLFSFQVHEKTILVVALPVLLYQPQKPFVCFWFLCVSIFSMVPLLVRDGLVVAMVALVVFYCTAFRVCIEHFVRGSLNVSDGLAEYYRSLLHVLLDIEYKKACQWDIVRVTWKQVVKNGEALKMLLFHALMWMSLWGCCFLTVGSLVIAPPRRFPDLWPLLISVYSAVHFFGFFVYFNVAQIQIPQYSETVKLKKH